MAREEEGQPRRGLATMDIDVCRNAYGRQLGSFQTKGDVEEVQKKISIPENHKVEIVTAQGINSDQANKSLLQKLLYQVWRQKSIYVNLGKIKLK